MRGYKIEEAEALHISDKTLLVDAPEFDEPIWIPHSQITDDSEVYDIGTEGTLIVTEWYAEKKGWL